MHVRVRSVGVGRVGVCTAMDQHLRESDTVEPSGRTEGDRDRSDAQETNK